MICPNCSSPHLHELGKWVHGAAIGRRRQCAVCDAIFVTAEMILAHNGMVAADWLVATPTGLLIRVDDLEVGTAIRDAVEALLEHGL